MGASQQGLSAQRAVLFEIIHTRSFGRRDVVLASGERSNFYFDMKPTMMDPEGASLIARLILPEVVGVGGAYIGGLEIGAVPVIGAVAMLSHQLGTPVSGFFVRKKKKEHGAQKLVEGLVDGVSLSGKRVVIFDDVTTSGGSAFEAMRACRDEGAVIVLALSIVDREAGAEKAFAAEGVPFRPLFRASEFLALG